MGIKTGLVSLLLFAGCATTPVKEYKLNNINFFFAESNVIQREYDKFDFNKKKVLGFYVPETKTAYVPWDTYVNSLDKDGERLPDFKILGHEVYHALKLRFHDW
jgi:hypothetical protein